MEEIITSRDHPPPSTFQQDMACFSQFCFLVLIKLRCWELRWTIAALINHSCQTLREGDQNYLTDLQQTVTAALNLLLAKDSLLNRPLSKNCQDEYLHFPSFSELVICFTPITNVNSQWQLRTEISLAPYSVQGVFLYQITTLHPAFLKSKGKYSFGHNQTSQAEEVDAL